jgi:TraM recognition site of TraD and TraG
MPADSSCLAHASRRKSRAGRGLTLMNINLGTYLTSLGTFTFQIDLDKSQFRHAWIIGKSGTGKSTLLRNLAVSILQSGAGLAVQEPHGDLIYDLLNYFSVEDLERLTYISPDSDRAPDIGLFHHPDKELALQTFLSIIQAKSGQGWGPETAHILRAATDASLELCPNPSILDVYKILARPDFAKRLLMRSKDPLINDFYQQYFVDLKPIERARNFSHPLNKIEELLRPGLREFLCQKKHLSFNGIMDRSELLFASLPKSKMGDRPVKTLGQLILSKINLASFQRKKRNRPFFVIIDEIHNFIAGIDFETMLAESRKFGVHYIFATQTLEQMRQAGELNDRIAFGNCSHIFSFRTNAKDAQDISANFGNEEAAPELVLLPNYHFKALTMTGGTPMPSDSVSLAQYPEMTGNELAARKAIQHAKDNTGVPKDQVNAYIENALRN